MALSIHIFIAFLSVIYSTYLFIKPSKLKLFISYGLVASTLVTGSYLIVVNPSHMVQACVVGLIYVGVVLIEIILARTKLVKQKI